MIYIDGIKTEKFDLQSFYHVPFEKGKKPIITPLRCGLNSYSSGMSLALNNPGTKKPNKNKIDKYENQS